MNSILLLAAGTPNIEQLLISFIVLIVVIAIIGGLIWAIETWIIKGAIPFPIKLVIGLILILLVVIWGIRIFGAG